MEEEEKYEAEQEAEVAEEAHIYRYYTTDAPPQSILHTRFAGPGSAQILEMRSEGVVTPEQLSAAGVFMVCRAFQEWSIPLISAIVRDIVGATINEFMVEMAKPKINTPAFWQPPNMRGGRPA